MADTEEQTYTVKKIDGIWRVVNDRTGQERGRYADEERARTAADAATAMGI